MLRNLQLRGGVVSFLFTFLLQAGLFFAVPLFLSIALGLSAIETGVRLLPLSLSLLLFAVGVPKVLPEVSPRRVIRAGFMALFAGLVLLVALLDVGSGAGGHHLAVAALSARGSARWPRSSGASRFRRCPTKRAARSAGFRTPGPSSAPRSAPPWPVPC